MSNDKVQQAKQAAIKKLFVRAGEVQVKKEMTNLVRLVAMENKKHTIMLLKRWIDQTER